MKSIRIFLFFLITFSLFSCNEDMKGPLVKGDEIPQPISSVKVENFAGGAFITYTLPDDPNIIFVQAKYLRRGVNEVKTISSVFKNMIEINGLADTNEQIVELTTVNKFRNSSEVTRVTINPLTPPITELFNSIKYGATFGGINYSFINEKENEYTVYTIVKDSDGSWYEYDRFYSKAKLTNNSVRGFDPVNTSFGIYVADVWQNISDTLFFDVTPLYEEKFDKTLWRQHNLPDDSTTPRYGPLSELWSDKDDVLTDRSYFFMSPNIVGLSLPNWFTIDLGKEYKFGRMRVHNVHHGNYWQYALGTPKKFEIWGTNSPSINWDDWTLLGEFECFKPSGSPPGIITDQDLAQLKSGDEYEFPFQEENAFYRYIRFKTITTFGDLPDVFLLELTFWGQQKN